jgi:hypothetical protein
MLFSLPPYVGRAGWRRRLESNQTNKILNLVQVGPLFTPIWNEQNIDWERETSLKSQSKKANIRRRDYYRVTPTPIGAPFIGDPSL